MYDGPRRVAKPFDVPHTKGGLDKLVAQAVGDSSEVCEVIMEPTRLIWLAVAAELKRRGHRVYVPKPQKTKDFRRVLSRHTKTDSRDAEAAALLRHVDEEGVYELQVPSAEAMTLRLFLAQRSRLVLEGSRCKNRIHAWLVLAWPGLSALGGDVFGGAGRMLLANHADPFEVRARGRKWLKDFWHRQSDGMGVASQADAVWESCEATCGLFEALRAEGKLPFDYVAIQTLLAHEIEHLDSLGTQIAALEEVIRRTYEKLDPDRVLEREVPGVGPLVAPTIEAYVGNIARFRNIRQFAAYFGLVPRTHQTGGKAPKSGQRLTRSGPNLLKHYLYLAAESARRTDPELAAAYQTAIERGKHHFSAVVIIAHKLVRRVFALLRARAEATAAAKAGEEASPIKYKLHAPGGGEQMTKKEARAWVREHYPSKAAAKKAAAAAQQNEGSPDGATKATVGQPPTASLPRPRACGKMGVQAVEKLCTS